MQNRSHAGRHLHFIHHSAFIIHHSSFRILFMPDSAIQVASVTKTYDGRTILDKIVLDVYEGETLVILGGSGSGKSTLLRLMIGNVRCDGGDIIIKGPGGKRRSMCNMTPDELDGYRKTIGVLFQSGALFNSM